MGMSTPTRFSPDIIADFRGASVFGLTLFWLVFALGFALLLRLGAAEPSHMTSRYDRDHVGA